MIFSGTWLIASMICGILVNYVSNFYLIVICFIIFLSCGTAASVVIAVSVNLYPTNYRAMAVAFTMIFGRLGSVSGSSIIGFLLQDHCSLIFYIYGGVLISNYPLNLSQSVSKMNFESWLFSLLGCALVFMMIKIKPQ